MKHAFLIAMLIFAFPQMLPADRIHTVITASAIIDVVDEYERNGILLVRRWKEPVGIALPSTALRYDEAIEDAALRAVRDETGLTATHLRPYRVYSDPKRDHRFHNIEFVFTGETCLSGVPVPAGDVEEVLIVKKDEIPWDELALNQAEILRDYYDQCSSVEGWYK
jgi:8-oxo-dGTP diphosphatase